MCRSTTKAAISTHIEPLECDGIVFDIYGIIVRQPAGVCLGNYFHTEDGAGFMLRCGDSGNMAYYQYEIIIIVLCCIRRNRRLGVLAKYVEFVAPVIDVTITNNDGNNFII